MPHTNILCIICLILLIVILLHININEGYEDVVPEYCGTAGLKYTSSLIQNLKTDGININKNKRFYTPSECDKIGGIFVPGTFSGLCYKLKDDTKKNGNYNLSADNIDINYYDKCGGLNKLNSAPPSECSADGRVLGKMNKAYNQTKNGKTVLVDNNTIRLYTKSECDKLSGNFQKSIDDMKKNKAKQEEIDNFIKINGKEYGMCFGKEMMYSILCGTEEAPTATKEISDVLKKNMKSWLE